MRAARVHGSAAISVQCCDSAHVLQCLVWTQLVLCVVVACVGIVASWETPKLQLCARIRESGTHSDIMWRAWFRCSRWHTVDRLLFCVSIAVAASPGRVLDGLGVAVPSIPSACVSPFPNGLGFLKSVLRRCELRCQGVVRPWRSRSAANATSIKALFGRRGLSLHFSRERG